MDNFSEISCDNCGSTGNWTCFKIYINDNDDVREQLKINIFKEGGKIWGKFEDGMFTPVHIEISILLIRAKIDEEQSNNYPSKSKGTAFIMVDFLNDEPYNRISAFDLDGITIDEVHMFIDAITGKKVPKGISPALNTKLEAAYEDWKNGNTNPFVIAHLKDKDDKVNIYLIAKEPEEEIYFGIIENEVIPQRQITDILLSDIKAMEAEAIPMKPFRAEPYIENGIKEYSCA